MENLCNYCGLPETPDVHPCELQARLLASEDARDAALARNADLVEQVRDACILVVEQNGGYYDVDRVVAISADIVSELRRRIVPGSPDVQKQADRREEFQGLLSATQAKLLASEQKRHMDDRVRAMEALTPCTSCGAAVVALAVRDGRCVDCWKQRYAVVYAATIQVDREVARLRPVEKAARVLLDDETNIYGQGDWWVCGGCDAAVDRSVGLPALKHHEGCAVLELFRVLDAVEGVQDGQ